MKILRKTKIVATLGPSISSPENLRKALEAGVDVCRINCSQCDETAILKNISNIRRVAASLHRSVAILLDLQGPKIRCGTIDPDLKLSNGDILTIVMDKNYLHSDFRIGTTWPSMANDVKPGERVLFADGALSGIVQEVRLDLTPAEVDIKINVGGILKSRKGINLPESNILAPALTPKDEADLVVGVQAGVDYVALSFARHKDDLIILKKRLAELGYPDLPTIAKIEKPQAVKNINEILNHTDGIMVARGDLGVEIPIARVPVVQKEIIQAAKHKGKLVITATQMLESMTDHPFPTRAEVTDVANAILDGSDAVMLSGETSVGKYPFLTIRTMSDIALQTESSSYATFSDISQISILQGKYKSVVRAACNAAKEGDRPMVVFTWSGNSAILASRTRPPQHIFAVTPNATVVDKLRLVWGVHAIQVPQIQSTEELIVATEKELMSQGLLARGDEVVILGGNAPLRGASNLMKIEVIDGLSQ
jgi:pyruvate kinase